MATNDHGAVRPFCPSWHTDRLALVLSEELYRRIPGSSSCSVLRVNVMLFQLAAYVREGSPAIWWAMTARLQNALITSTAVYSPLANANQLLSCGRLSGLLFLGVRSPQAEGMEVTSRSSGAGRRAVGVCHSGGMRASTALHLVAAMLSHVI